MASGLVIICGRSMKKVVTGSLTVEREDGYFIVTIAEEVFPATVKIRDAVRVLENRSLASRITKAFERATVNDKVARKIFTGFGVRYFPTESCYHMVVKASSFHMDSKSINLEALKCVLSVTLI